MKNLICVHCKEIYPIRPHKCKICGCQTFESTEAKIKEIEKGTIKWFEIDKIKPDAENPLQGPLKTYLVAYNQMAISPANFDHYFDMFINYNLSDTPTHWAHINWPS